MFTCILPALIYSKDKYVWDTIEDADIILNNLWFISLS